MKVYLLLGANLGDRQATLERARVLVAEQAGTLLGASPVYETAAWGVADQPPYLNQVLEVLTTLAALDLLNTTQSIEHRLGRQHSGRWEARLIDIDILYYGHEIIAHPRLQVPHPLLHLRRFALAPLCDLAPDMVHPLFRETQAELLDKCPDNLPARPLENITAAG